MGGEVEKKSRLSTYARVKSELKRERYLDFLRRGEERSVGLIVELMTSWSWLKRENKTVESGAICCCSTESSERTLDSNLTRARTFGVRCLTGAIGAMIPYVLFVG